jgi:hypothetical protein
MLLDAGVARDVASKKTVAMEGSLLRWVLRELDHHPMRHTVLPGRLQLAGASATAAGCAQDPWLLLLEAQLYRVQSIMPDAMAPA